MPRWRKTRDGRWVRNEQAEQETLPSRRMYGFEDGTLPQELCRRINIITPEGHREILLERIDAARRENRGAR